MEQHLSVRDVGTDTLTPNPTAVTSTRLITVNATIAIAGVISGFSGSALTLTATNDGQPSTPSGNG